ncbi:MAG TPA: acyl-CoA dehydrogenase family protein [Gemmatimonadales bacterium]|nr:acyl-CoA dehydrogenase family protein [Gemmatimonadales bacterium]
MPDVAAVRAFLDPSHLELEARFAGFAANQVAPLPAPHSDDDARAQARALAGQLGKGGWLRPIGERDLRACCLIRETLAAASPLADAVFALQALGATPLVLAGTEAQKRQWLDPTLSGHAVAAFAMTEPGAGSDVSAMTTRAEPDGAGYRLSGSKTLISNAGLADYYVVFASADPGSGSKGVGCFVVPADAPGLRFVGAQVLSAPHPLGDITLEDCPVSPQGVLAAPGDGLKLGFATLDRLRATVGAAACGMAARALAEALEHVRTRKQFGRALAEFQLTQEKLARMTTDLTAARLLVYRAAADQDAGREPVTAQSAMAKAFATEAAQRIVDDAVQLLGGRALLAAHPVDRLYRAVRALRIYEGTTEIQHLIIARQLLGSDRGPAASS